MSTRLTKKQQAFVNKVKAVQLRLSSSETVNDMSVNQVSAQLNVIHREAIGKAPGDIYTGDIVMFDRSDEELLALSISLTPYQSGTGDPSPTNIRPISGFDAVNAYVRGFNQWDEEWELGYWNKNTGAKVSSSSQIRGKNFIPVVSGTTYYLYQSNGTAINALYYDAEKNYLSENTQTVNTTITTPSDCHYITIYMPSSYGTAYNHDICINISGEYNGIYEPYNPASATYYVTLPQTVYGGSVNVLTGEVTSSWAVIDSYAGEPLPGKWISDRDVYIAGATPTTGAQVCYELDEPVSLQTVGNDVALLDGYNIIWSDAGSIEAIIL